MMETTESSTRDKVYGIGADGNIDLYFHAGQQRVWDSKKRFVFALAGTRGGKTALIPWWLYREILATASPGGGNDYLAVSSTFKLFNNAFLPAMMEVFEHVLEIGHYWTATQVMEIKCLDENDPKFGEFYQGPTGRSTGLMWGRIIMHTAQSDGSLESMTARAAALDECGQDAFRLSHWEAVLRRVAIGERRVLGTTTPYNLGWLYENIYQKWLDGDLPDTDIIQFPSTLNPIFSVGEFERARRTMDGWRFSMFYEGKFQRPASLIYHDFDPVTMLFNADDATQEDYIAIQPEWERAIGIDFGGANVGVLFLAFNPYDGRWYVYDELLMGHMSTQAYVNIVLEHLGNTELVTVMGGAKSEDQYRTDWSEAGLYVEEPLVHAVEPGIARVISLLKKDKLRVARHCTRLRREFRGYRRKMDDRHQPTEQIVDKSRWHLLDSLRYIGSWIEDEPLGVDVMTYEQYLGMAEKEQAHEPTFA